MITVFVLAAISVAPVSLPADPELCNRTTEMWRKSAYEQLDNALVWEGRARDELVRRQAAEDRLAAALAAPPVPAAAPEPPPELVPTWVLIAGGVVLGAVVGGVVVSAVQ